MVYNYRHYQTTFANMSEIKQSKIEFTVKEFAGYQIKQRADGYLYATEMCKVGKKEWKHYNQNNQTKEYLDALSKDLNKSISNLIESTRTGLNEKRGTWVHPRVAIHLAMWISPKFAVSVSKWVVEWYSQSTDNYKKFIHEISNLEPSECSKKEKKIQIELAASLQGQMEVKTPVGFIDILTQTHIIEIKEASCWKHALGQILIYGEYYPNYNKKIILFGKLPIGHKIISNAYSKHNVVLELLQ